VGTSKTTIIRSGLRNSRCGLQPRFPTFYLPLRRIIDYELKSALLGQYDLLTTSLEEEGLFKGLDGVSWMKSNFSIL
jgi:hypothetical protein